MRFDLVSRKIFLLVRVIIRPGLAGTVPVLRPCPGVPAGLVEMSRFFFRCDDHSIIRKKTRAAGVKTFFFLFLRSREKSHKNGGSLE